VPGVRYPDNRNAALALPSQYYHGESPARAGRGIPELVGGILLCAWERCPGGALRIAASRGKVERRSKTTIRVFRWRPREAVHTVDWQ
jgi:hypothetical protein